MQVKGLVGVYYRLRVNGSNAISGGIHLVLSHGVVGGDNLPVDVGRGDPIVVKQVECADTGSC